MLTIIATWTVLFFAIFFIGYNFFEIFLKKLFEKEKGEWYEYFWIGLVICVIFLQIWSIFLPVNYLALFTVLITGIAGAILFIKKNGFIKIKEILLFYRKNKGFVFLGGLILLLISYFASLPVGWTDTLLYHLNAVKWANTYPVVPGLANLHSRFGLNSSLFLLASMADNFFLKDRSSHIILSLIASSLSLEILWIFLKPGERVKKLFIALMLPLFIGAIAKRTMVATLSPDFALMITVFAISIETLINTRFSLFTAALLGIYLITIKFSGLVFSGVIAIYVFYGLAKSGFNKWFKIVKWIFVLSFLILLPFIIRNIILTGWPFYPAPILGTNFSWAVPRQHVEGMFTVIKTWAIYPGEGWSNYVGLSFWQWFPDWYSRNNWHIEMKMFVFGAVLAIVSPFLKLGIWAEIKKNKGIVLIFLAGLLSSLYALFTAPDFRFAETFQWIMFASIASVFLYKLEAGFKPIRTLTVLVVIYFVFVIAWPARIDSKPIWRSVRWEPSFPVQETKIVPNDGSPSFTFYEPLDDLCGNSLLPCSTDSLPRHGGIKERVPGDMSKGYEAVD